MKQLFWKEWRELRLLPLGATLCCVLGCLGFFMACRLQLAGLQRQDYVVNDLVGVFSLVWLLFTVIAGSGLISQEIGAGTLSFLFTLPVSRRRIWLIKAASGFAAVVLCALCSGLACLLFWAFTAHWGTPESFSSGISSFLGDTFLGIAGCYAVSLAASTLLDRHIGATMVSVMACIALFYVIIFANNGPFDNQYVPSVSTLLQYVCLWLAVPAFLAVSYWTFTHGENLRSAKRFYAAGAAGVVVLAVFLAIYFPIRAYAVARYVHPETASAASPVEPGALHTQYPWYDMSADEAFYVSPHAGKLYAVEELEVDGQTRRELTIPLSADQRSTVFTARVKAQNAILRPGVDRYRQPVDTPPVAVFSVRLEANGKQAHAPVMLIFKNGAGIFDVPGLSPKENDNGLFNAGGDLLDVLFVDKSLRTAPAHWEIEPNDPTFTSRYPPDTVHRITIRAGIYADPVAKNN